MGDKNIIHKVSRRMSADGSIEEQTAVIVRKVQAEPDFVKMYLDDVAVFNRLTRKQRLVLDRMLQRMDYNNEVNLPVGAKVTICVEAGIFKQGYEDVVCDAEERVSLNSLNFILSSLCSSELVSRKAKGVYLINPHIFGKGKWTDIEAIRLTVNYSKEGKRVESAIRKKSDKILGRNDHPDNA